LGGGGGARGEMTQALYAHMNNKIKKNNNEFVLPNIGISHGFIRDFNYEIILSYFSGWK
jgi:hypothetical protein